ncbi:MAG: sortase domain-bontaining protein [Actinomycetes bacterium]
MPYGRSTTTATIFVVAVVVAVCSAWALISQPPMRSIATPTTAPGQPTRPPQADVSPNGARAASPTPSPPLVPEQLTIPAIGVDASVVRSGVTRNGDAEIPADGDVIGWYQYSDAPGSTTGSTVLIGHRDTNAEGPGALFDLDLLSVGDQIAVKAGRRTLGYRVTAVRSVAKASLPPSLFRRQGPPQLVVITCGGAYLPDAGGYQENLYVKAVPERG